MERHCILGLQCAYSNENGMKMGLGANVPRRTLWPPSKVHISGNIGFQEKLWYMQYSPDIVLTGYAIKKGGQNFLLWPILLEGRYIAAPKQRSAQGGAGCPAAETRAEVMQSPGNSNGGKALTSAYLRLPVDSFYVPSF